MRYVTHRAQNHGVEFREDLASFLEDPQLDRELDDSRAHRTQRLEEISAGSTRTDSNFFAARHSVFEDWRLECREAETRYLLRKLRDPSISRFPGLGDLLSGVVARRS